jgi:hypothetical protein
MDIEKEIEQIKTRNERVEMDKKWERSPIRIALVCLLTYGIVLLYSFLISDNTSIFLTSAVPVIGFVLSGVSLNLIRKLVQRHKKN